MSQIAQAHLRSLPTPWAGQLHSGKHRYMTDKPTEFGGQDAAPAPYDYLSASLASCTMITLRMYAQHKGIELGEFEVDVRFFAHADGSEHIERRLKFDRTLEDALAAKVLDICQKTPVTKTLLRGTRIETQLVSAFE